MQYCEWTEFQPNSAPTKSINIPITHKALGPKQYTSVCWQRFRFYPGGNEEQFVKLHNMRLICRCFPITSDVHIYSSVTEHVLWYSKLWSPFTSTFKISADHDGGADECYCWCDTRSKWIITRIWNLAKISCELISEDRLGWGRRRAIYIDGYWKLHGSTRMWYSMWYTFLIG